MNRNHIRHSRTRAVICCACLGSLATSGNVMAQATRETDSSSARSSTPSSTQQRSASANVENVRVTRASNFLGTDVIASDGRKVGDIVDYYFDLKSTPHLQYVVIMTGGFLNMGGDSRAVPASAVTATGDSCRINISSTQYWDVPVLPENRGRFLSDAQHRQRISQLFSQSGQTSARSGSTGASTPSTSSTTATDTSGPSDSTSNRAGAMTGRPSGQAGAELVSFSELRNADAYGQDGQRLGYFMDAWINLNEDRAPYVEITPTFEPFRTSFDRRYAVPTAKIAQKRDYAGYTLKVTSDELDKAEPVTETEGVKMLEEGRVGNTVLRVTVPEPKN